MKKIILLVLVNSFFSVNYAYAANEICTFTTKAVFFANKSSPAEPFSFKWLKSTGQVLNFSWLHGGVNWFSYVQDPGTVIPDKFPSDYHYRLNLGITTTGFESTRYQLLGYVQTNLQLPSATFAAIYEGTGAAWLVANGKLVCKTVP